MNSADYADYDDDYATCAETYATLRVYELAPQVVTSALGLEPDSTQTRGDAMYPRAGSPLYRVDGWFMTSRGFVASRDVRRHLDWLLDRLEPCASALRDLRSAGARMDVSCFWASASGHGGPALSPKQSQRLGNLDLEVWFDVYFWDEEE